MNRIATVLALGSTLIGVPALADEIFLSVDEAKALLAKGEARVICADAEKDCAKEHVKGAVFSYSHDLQYLDDVRSCKGLPMCEPAAAATIGALGIDGATPVIVYDGGMGANASGSWFFLTLYGHKNVKILDGGLATWKAHGGAVESGASAKVAAKKFAPTVDYTMLADVEEVKKATQDGPHYLLLDARHNLEEYTGKTLQASLKGPGKEITVARGGFIPGAVFSPWTKYAGNKDAEAGQAHPQGQKDLQKQLEKLKKNGYDAGKTVITYCHVGLGRGSFQYLALKKAGHKNVKLYIGSWAEWGNTESLPSDTQP